MIRSRTLRRVALLSLTFVVFGMTACNKQEEPTPPPETAVEPKPEAAQPTPPPTPTAPPKAVEQPKKVEAPKPVEVKEMDETPKASGPTMVLSGRTIRVKTVSQQVYGETGVFQVQNLLDNNIETAWMEQVAGDGVGEGVEFTFDQTYAIFRIEVWNGFQAQGEGGDQFPLYQRVRQFSVDSGDGKVQTFDLTDAKEPQSFYLKELKTDHLRLSIASIYEGAKDETAFAEVKVHVIRPEEQAAAPAVAGPTPVQGVDKNVMTMADIPAGTYTLGLGTDQIETTVELCLRGTAESKCEVDMFEDLEPQHQVSVSTFYMDQYEVTNGDYSRCVMAGMCAPSKEADDSDLNAFNQPVVGVNWYDAAAYCNWANKRLPTEAEWEYAARRQHNGRYAWGNDKPTPEKAVYCDERCQKSGYSPTPDPDRRKGPDPVNSMQMSATADGLYHMSGNVFEWVYDAYDERFYKTCSRGVRDPVREAKRPDEDRVIRGGAWDVAPTLLDTRYRRIKEPDARENDIGFRCASSNRAGGTVQIPGGSFTRGVTTDEAKTMLDDCFQDSEMKKCSFRFRFGDQTPQIDVSLAAYKIDKFPVTNGMYKACYEAKKCKKEASLIKGGYNADDQPVTFVPWDDADNYCEFAGKRLCTEAEWEVAARGGETALFPWNSLEITLAHAKYCDDACGRIPSKNRNETIKPDPVLSRSLNASKFGVYDMVGNVHQWVADKYVKNAYSKCGANCTQLFNKSKSKSDNVVVRGGSIYDGSAKTTTTYRGYRKRTKAEENLGFRCCM